MLLQDLPVRTDPDRRGENVRTGAPLLEGEAFARETNVGKAHRRDAVGVDG